jgi:hypothetical protein
MDQRQRNLDHFAPLGPPPIEPDSPSKTTQQLRLYQVQSRSRKVLKRNDLQHSD